MPTERRLPRPQGDAACAYLLTRDTARRAMDDVAQDPGRQRSLKREEETCSTVG
jgi:hypothetical protein